MAVPAPRLIFTAVPREPAAAALVLHGGRENGTGPVRSHQVAVLRMLPFAKRLASLGDDRLVVARLQYAVRGWNGAEASPVADAQWALAQLAERFPTLPVGLLGHSMGGRTALRAAGAARVTSVVALAPWLPPGEPLQQLAERNVLLVHGSSDRLTSPRGSAAFASRLHEAGIGCTYLELAGGTHAMLRRARLWHDLAAGFLVETLLADSTVAQSVAEPAPNLLRRVLLGEDWISA